MTAASGRGDGQMELPIEGSARLAVWVRGEVWSYKEGSTRIYSFGGDEINVWDHAAGAPGIEFTREAIEARVKEWLADEDEPAAKVERITCRSRAAMDCYDGRPAAEVYPEGQDDDGTWDGETVVCDACYIWLGQPTSGDPASIAGGKGRHGGREQARHAGTVRVPDGHGCTERVPAWELDPYGYEGNQ